ncbi:GNAT family N-acetyltransferase [Paenibacillus sp. 598K]|nr:GNAT family N-acetyltransferase [Paenibacillus sp. 598K]
MMTTITPYTKEMHEALVDIWERAVRQTHHFLTEADIAFFRTMVRDQALTSCPVWVASDEAGRPVGFIGKSDNRNIEMLFVDPDHHGKGIGRQLMAYAMADADYPVAVDVNEQNSGAVSFYQRLGFQTIGRSERDGTGKPFPLLHLEKRQREGDES